MQLDLDTFLTTVYCTVSDLYQAHFASLKPKRCGVQPQLSDEEVLTLAILAQWQPHRSEREFLREQVPKWRGYFPRMLSQSQLNRRMRDVAGVLSALAPAIGILVSEQVKGLVYEVLDGVPVPLMRRCRGDRHRCFANEAAIGVGGSDRDYYYGVKLLSVVNNLGVITGFVFGPANSEERWLAEALLRWRSFPNALPPALSDLEEVLPRWRPSRGARRGPTGPITPATGVGQATAPLYLADLGFAGQHWQPHWFLDYGAPILTQDTFAGLPNQAQLQRQLHGLRQVVEDINNLLTASLGLAFPRARTPWGLLMRLSAKVAACNFTLLFNYRCQRPPFAHLSPFSL